MISAVERKTIWIALFAVIAFVLVRILHEHLYVIYDPNNYLALHTILEFLSIAVSFSIAFSGWLIFPHSLSRHRLFLGSVFLAVGLLDLLHTISFKGMPFFFSASSVSKATWFWILARLTESAFLLFLLSLADKPASSHHRRTVYGSSFLYVIGIAVLVVTAQDALPVLVVEGQGTTLLKNTMEYLISSLHLFTMGVVFFQYYQNRQVAHLHLMSAFVFLFFSELTFTLYRSVYDLDNLLGHLFKVFGYYFLFKGIYSSTLEEPYFHLEQAKKALEESKERYRNLIVHSPFGVLVYAENKIKFINPKGMHILGAIQLEELLGKSISDFIHPDQRNLVNDGEKDMGKPAKKIDHLELQVYRLDGRLMDIDCTYVPIDYNGQTAIQVLFQDITLRKQEEEKLKLYEKVVETTLHGVVITDKDGSILQVNPAFTALTGYHLEEVKTKNPRILKSGKHDASFYERMWQSLLTAGQWKGEIWNKHKEGKLFPELLDISAIRGRRGEITHYVALCRDITEIKEVERKLQEANEKLKKLSRMDGLTGIANRRYLDDYLHKEWDRAVRHSSTLSVILLDIDYFKSFNDTYGHLRGDDCLKEIGCVLSRIVERATDLVARYGGEEFAVILPDTEQEGAMIVAQLIRSTIEKLKIPHEGSKIGTSVTVSVGVATMIPSASGNPHDLLDRADQALYQAKQNGRNQVVLSKDNQVKASLLTN